jgi:hypothetical protein
MVQKFLAFLIVALLSLAGFTMGQANGAKATGLWQRYSEQWAGDTYLCHSGRATILTDLPPVEYEEAAYGESRRRSTTGCDVSHNAPAGYLGLRVQSVNGSGDVCATSTFFTNVDPTDVLERGVAAGCPAANYRQSIAMPRWWRSSVSSWCGYWDCAAQIMISSPSSPS